ncbi:hypothetical protein BGZ61DRAFT_515543 [Ilyonectria robusta]|uniref:uncharacterized protein n=1 Tax=Ilyonectria robusta TaxID=1079257 RepID=UPI001E8D729E|nr:uncharacterized protein BGZ61DRAFT_515543 [Ilyonectria robusta]KAH8729485.1 hypothetical protein BGZ61DRAFT_515543 [Ilyonectria robusta]
MPARPYRPVHRPDETPTRVGPNGFRRPSPYDGMGNDPDDRYRPDHCPHCLIYLSGSKDRGYLCANCEPLIDSRIWLVLKRAAVGVCSGRCGGYLSPEERSAQRYMCDRCLPGWRAHVQDMADSGIVSAVRRREFRTLRHSYEADMREQATVGGRCINLRCARPMQAQDCFDPWVPRGYRFAYCSTCRLELTVDGYPDPARMAITEHAVHNTAAPQGAPRADQNQTAGHSAAGNTTGGFNIHRDRAARASEGMNLPPFLTGDDVLAAERLLQMRSGQLPNQQFPNQQYTDENRQPSGGSIGASTLVMGDSPNTRAPLGDRSENI